MDFTQIQVEVIVCISLGDTFSCAMKIAKDVISTSFEPNHFALNNCLCRRTPRGPLFAEHFFT